MYKYFKHNRSHTHVNIMGHTFHTTTVQCKYSCLLACDAASLGTNDMVSHLKKSSRFDSFMYVAVNDIGAHPRVSGGLRGAAPPKPKFKKDFVNIKNFM
jgi:hypothetical protein